MSEKHNHTVEGRTEQAENDLKSAATARKQFIEPVVSTPVDVLEATSFFQGATGGTTVPGGIGD